MKRIILIAVLFASARLYAQDIPESNSPVRKLHHSSYGAMTTNYSKFNGDDALFVGAYGGWMINHKLMLGPAGQYLVTQHDGYGFNVETDKNNELKMGYGGLIVEYTFFENQRVHASVNSIIGFGVVTNGYHGGYDPETGETWRSKDESGVFAFHQFLTDFQTMEEVEDLLNPKFFYRANRQYIISINAVDSFRSDIYSKMILQLKAPLNLTVDISREKAQAFKNWIQ